METTGIVIKVLDTQRGLSAGTGRPWAIRGFVIETHDQYPRKQYIELFGEERINTLTPNVGDDVTVSIDIESRESNGRWYTSARAWKVAKAQAAQQLAAQPMPSATAPASAPAPTPAPTPAPAPQPMAAPAASNELDDNSQLPF